MRARAALASLVAAAALLSGCSSVGETNEEGFISGGGQVVEYGRDERDEPVTGVSGTTIEGDPIDLTDFAGKPVVVNIWSSDCTPCRKEMPMLTEAHAELGDGVEFLGLNTRDTSAERAKAFQEARGVDYPSIYSKDGVVLLAFGDRVPSTPSTIVLDRDHRVSALINGEIPSKLTLTTLVEKVLAEDG